MIDAKIITYTRRSDTGDELITYELTFPRIILSEVNTYRMASKNTSSSRAIPIEKMLEVVKENPFIPYAFQKAHNGMQGVEYFEDSKEIEEIQKVWLEARDAALTSTKKLSDIGVTKQICNRILEPFMWVTQLFTINRQALEHLFNQRSFNFIGSPSWKEFIRRNPQFESVESIIERLKINKGQAEIHFSFLVEKMIEALLNSTPNEDVDHIPYYRTDIDSKNAIVYSVAKTARVSYTTIEGEGDLTMETAHRIYNKCLKSGHWSVFEHIGLLMSEEDYGRYVKGVLYRLSEDTMEFEPKAYGWSKNFRGFIQYRQILEVEI